MPTTYFVNKQQRINDFVTRANPLLGDNPLYYPGHFITGQIENPDILFISINPGHSNREDWEDVAKRRAQTQVTDFAPLPIKYSADAERGSRYANRILDIVCGGGDGGRERLARCAETNFVSYFAAPKEAVLQQQLATLPAALQSEHEQLTRLDIDEIEPKHILCIGWRAFERFLAQYGEGSEIVLHKLPLIGTMEDYYAHTQIAGVQVHGVRHLCTKLSLDMKANLAAIFAKIWADIER